MHYNVRSLYLPSADTEMEGDTGKEWVTGMRGHSCVTDPTLSGRWRWEVPDDGERGGLGRLALKEGHLLFPTLSLNVHPSD